MENGALCGGYGDAADSLRSDRRRDTKSGTGGHNATDTAGKDGSGGGRAECVGTGAAA